MLIRKFLALKFEFAKFVPRLKFLILFSKKQIRIIFSIALVYTIIMGITQLAEASKKAFGPLIITGNCETLVPLKKKGLQF
jgi:hypothetical protein